MKNFSVDRYGIRVDLYTRTQQEPCEVVISHARFFHGLKEDFKYSVRKLFYSGRDKVIVQLVEECVGLLYRKEWKGELSNAKWVGGILLKEKIFPAILKVLGIKFVNVYDVGRAFGGPQEGGWWYDVRTPMHENGVQGCQVLVVDGRKQHLDVENPFTRCLALHPLLQVYSLSKGEII